MRGPPSENGNWLATSNHKWAKRLQSNSLFSAAEQSSTSLHCCRTKQQKGSTLWLTWRTTVLTGCWPPSVSPSLMTTLSRHRDF